MTIDTKWVAGSGYRPVRVEFNTTGGPAPADRTLLVEFSPNDWSGNNGQLYVSRYIDIPEGATTARATIGVPQREVWHSMSVNVYEDGKHIKELSLAGTGIQNSGEWSEALPKLLVIHRDAPLPADRGDLISRTQKGRTMGLLDRQVADLPDLRAVSDVLQGGDARTSGWGASTGIDRLELIDEHTRMELLPPVCLPENWVELTSLDLILVSLDDLTLMQSKYPRRFEAIRTATAAGQTLCVWGVGEQYERLAELERLVDARPLPGADTPEPPFRGWLVPDRRHFGGQVTTIGEIIENEGYRPWRTPQATTTQQDDGYDYLPDGRRVRRDVLPSAPPADRPPFLLRPLDLGNLVAIGSDQPFPGNTATWHWLLMSLDLNDWQWYRRHGMSLQRENSDFWNFLIPGVGVAPVTAFRILISMFVIVIGPVNYFLLRRWGRLHLLLVTVPAGALLITGSLFLYALLSDGLGVRARVRSFTLLDQNRGRAISWSRQVYYAGLAPSQGLVYPRTAAVFPLHFDPWEEQRNRGTRRRMRWDDQQRLTSGWLRPRIMTQFLVVEAGAAEIGLDVAPPPEAGQPPAVTNGLGGRILKLCLRDEDGTYYFAEDAPAGAPCQLRKIDEAAAEDALRTVHSAHRPTFPEGYDSTRFGYQGRFRRGWYYGFYGMDERLPRPSTTTSRLEHSLTDATLGRLDLDRRSYVAVVERNPAVPRGTKSREEDSYHVIQASW